MDEGDDPETSEEDLSLHLKVQEMKKETIKLSQLTRRVQLLTLFILSIMIHQLLITLNSD